VYGNIHKNESRFIMRDKIIEVLNSNMLRGYK